MRLKVLASSSSGNCGLVELSNQKILIDAGMSFKKLTALLAEEGVSPAEISAVLVTHEHSDHVAGVSGFAALGAKIFATEGTALAAEGIVGDKVKWSLIPNAGAFTLGEGVIVESFRIPHDAADPVGFTVVENGERLTWVLDIGHLDTKMKERLAAADILMLESNYDAKKLEASKRPYHLKARISGRHGHLDNEVAFEYLTTTRSPHWKEIYLGHLSKECNDAEALEREYECVGMSVTVIDPAGVKVKE